MQEFSSWLKALKEDVSSMRTPLSSSRKSVASSSCSSLGTSVGLDYSIEVDSKEEHLLDINFCDLSQLHLDDCNMKTSAPIIIPGKPRGKLQPSDKLITMANRSISKFEMSQRFRFNSNVCVHTTEQEEEDQIFQFEW
jgi:hypothetical protein